MKTATRPTLPFARTLRSDSPLPAGAWSLVISLLLALNGLAASAVPVNDSFAKARLILPSQGQTGTLANQSNVGATAELGEPAVGGAAARHTVWYRINAPYATNFKVDVVDNVGLRMTMFQTVGEGALEALQAVQSTTNTLPGDIEHLSGGVSPNYTLYLAVDADAPGNFTINYRFSAQTADFFEDAVNLPGASGSAFGTNTGATLEPGEPAPSTADTHTVWRKWTAPSNANYTFDTIGSSFDTVLDIFTGSAVGALTSVGLSDSAVNVPDAAGLLSFNAIAGTTYYIRVYGHTAAAGSFLLNYYLSSGVGVFDIHLITSNLVGAGSSFAFTVRRLMGTTGTVAVHLATSSQPGGPVANTDYTPINQTLTFAPGEIEKLVSLTTFSTATAPPPNFVVAVALSAPTNGATLGSGLTAFGLFIETPRARTAPFLSFPETSITVKEGQSAVIPVLREGNPDVELSQMLTVVPAPGSARQKAGVDLNSVQYVSMGVAQMSSSIAIFIPEDYIFEGPEDVLVQYSGTTVATVHIVEDDPARPPAMLVFESVQLGSNGLGAFSCSVTLSPTGMVTGQIRARVGAFAFKAAMAPDGTATAFMPRANGLGELQIALQFREGFTKMHGHLQSPSGDVTADFDSSRGLTAADGPSAQAGHYTFYVSSLFIGGVSIANPFFGTMDISATGAVKIVGKLMDGQTVTIGSQQELSHGVHGAFLAGNHEFLGFTLNPNQIAGFSDFTGTTVLHKSPSAADKLYPAGFPAISGFTQAIRYAPPAAGSFALSAWSPAGAGKLVTAGGSLTALNLAFTASTAGTVHFTDPTLMPMVKLAPLTRSFTGSVKPVGHAVVPFSGILYQGTGTHSLGIGNYVADGKAGAVTLSGP